MWVVASRARGCRAIQATTLELGSGRISSEMTFVSTTITVQTLAAPWA